MGPGSGFQQKSLVNTQKLSCEKLITKTICNPLLRYLRDLLPLWNTFGGVKGLPGTQLG